MADLELLENGVVFTDLREALLRHQLVSRICVSNKAVLEDIGLRPDPIRAHYSVVKSQKILLVELGATEAITDAEDLREIHFSSKNGDRCRY